MCALKAVPLSAKERRAVDEFVARICKQYGRAIQLIRLFGSKARGSSDAESDVDLLVVVDRRDRQLWDGIVALETELMLKYDIVISSLIMDYQEYRWHQEHHAPLYRRIEREGVSLWMSTPAF